MDTPICRLGEEEAQSCPVVFKIRGKQEAIQLATLVVGWMSRGIGTWDSVAPLSTKADFRLLGGGTRWCLELEAAVSSVCGLLVASGVVDERECVWLGTGWSHPLRTGDSNFGHLQQEQEKRDGKVLEKGDGSHWR